MEFSVVMALGHHHHYYCCLVQGLCVHPPRQDLKNVNKSTQLYYNDNSTHIVDEINKLINIIVFFCIVFYNVRFSC